VIDGSTLAAMIDAEARHRAAKSAVDGEGTAAEKVLREFQKCPLPPTSILAFVVEELFWASLLEEEGRPCRPRLAYVLDEVDARPTAHWFETPVGLHRESLRKLTPTQGQHGYLTWTIGKNGPVVTGVQTRSEGAFVLHAPAAGAIDAIWSVYRVLTVRGGEVRRLSTCALPDAVNVFDVVKDAIGGMPNILVSTLLTVAEEGHGGSLWLVSAKRGANPAPLEGLRLGHPLRRGSSPLERFADETERLRWVASVAHLAAVDGAVVLDASARVLGFSAFVETGSPVPLIELLPSGETRRIASPDTGGGRHRSAAEFCRRAAPAAALVVSSDGRISVFAARSKDQPPLFSEVMSLGASVTAVGY
jgi:hypothetical protein